MSKYGLKVAVKYGEKLKKFSSKSEAEDYFFLYKNNLLNKLEIICKLNACFLPDYTVESLKKIEKWYFDMFEKNEFELAGVTRNEFESMMSVYFGEVVVKNNEDAKWLVEEFPFVPSKYELMVNKGGNCNMSIENKCQDFYKEPANKRRNLLFREYNKYFAE